MKLKCVLICFLLLNSFISHAQESIYTKVENEVCNCIQQKPGENLFSSSYFSNCLDQALSSNADSLVYAAADKYGDPNGKMDEFTKLFLDSVQTGLIYTCTIYFNKMDSSRYTVGILKDRGSLKQMLNDYKAHPSNTFNYFSNRAEVYFELGDYANAFPDINKAIQYNPKISGNHVTKGLLLEQQHRYKEAINEYQLALQLDAENEKTKDESRNPLRMFIAVASRKLANQR